MPENFDPYRTWLGIAENEQPPNHYRLLGIDEFESDVETIRNAGENRVQYLQDVSTGKNVAEAQRLLNQVAAAVVCLTHSEKKSAYDQQLRKGSANTAETTGRSKLQSVEPKQSKSRQRTQKQVAKKPAKSSFPIAAITVPVLLLVAFGAWYFMKGNQGNGSAKSELRWSDENWVPGKLVATDFTDAKAEESWMSPVGEWEFGEGVVINTTKDAKNHYLHLTGGAERKVTLRLSDDVDRRGILTLRAERWSDTGEFEFLVQYSVDGDTWTTIPREDYGDDFKKRSARSVGASWSVIYQLADPEMTRLRFVCNSKALSKPQTGGALIGSVSVAPRIR